MYITARAPDDSTTEKPSFNISAKFIKDVIVPEVNPEPETIKEDEKTEPVPIKEEENTEPEPIKEEEKTEPEIKPKEKSITEVKKEVISKEDDS